MIEFFMAMVPPSVTHQQKKVHVVNGKPVYYEPSELKAARSKLDSNLAKHKPNQAYRGPVRLTVKWCFPLIKKSSDGQYKNTKPDLDNLNKLLQDCMTKLQFWKDDSQVASLITEKFWAEIPGIYVRVEEL